MRSTEQVEPFAPLGGPIRATTTTTAPPKPPEKVNASEGVYVTPDGKFFTSKPVNEIAK